jgi:hypothetical protein
MKKFLNWLIFLLTGKGKVADDAVSDGLVNLGGQGRNKNGN